MTAGDAFRQGMAIVASLGPLIVAALVFNLNRTQARIANRIQQRTAEIEDQKFRLALLDRRIATLTAIRAIARDFYQSGEVSEAMVLRAHDLINEAELIYEDDLLVRLKAMRKLLSEWLFRHRRREKHAMQGDHEHEAMALAREQEIEGDLITLLDEVLPLLAEASRVRTVSAFRL